MGATSNTTRTPAAPAAAFHELRGGQLALTLLGLLLAMFFSALDQTVVSTAMPSIIASLHGLDRYAWVFTSYMVTSTAGVLVFGKLSDIYGRKWLYMGGIAVFLAGSALSGLSRNMDQLIAFRALQGVGAGIMMSISFAIIGDIFPPAKRAKWMGVFSGVFALASVIGPTMGGYITDHWSWRWAFYINLPVGGLALAAIAAFMPWFKGRGREHPIDYTGVALMLLSVVPMLVGLSLTSLNYKWTSPQVIGLLAVAAVMLVAFVWWEAVKAKDPVLPMSFFKDRIFSVSMFVVFLTSLGMFGAVLFLPLFIQGVIGRSASASGNALIPMMLGMVGGAFVSGQVMGRTGRYRLIGVAGIGLACFGMYMLSRATVDTSYGATVRDMVIVGVGLGTTMPLFTIAVQNAFPQRVLGQVSSAIQFFRGIGATMGSAVFGSVFVAHFHRELLGQLPQQVASAVTTGNLSALSNPQSLSSPAAQQAMGAQLAQYGITDPSAVQGLMGVVKGSIATAFGEVFVMGLVIVAIAWSATWFIKEIPLRKTNAPEETAEAQEAASEAPR